MLVVFHMVHDHMVQAVSAWRYAVQGSFDKKIEYMDYAPGCLSTLMNLIWLIVGGIWIALSHLLIGLLLGITIIGIPWARQHFKLVSLALTPFGRRVTG